MPGVSSEWSALLGLALPLLDHVFKPLDPAQHPKWTLGGTAIMLQIEHRISHSCT